MEKFDPILTASCHKCSTEFYSHVYNSMNLYEYQEGHDLTCNNCGDVLKSNSQIGRELLVELLEHVIQYEEPS